MTEAEIPVVDGMLPLVKERLRLLPQVTEMVRFLFKEINEYAVEDIVPKKLDAGKTAEILKTGRVILEQFAEKNDEQNEQAFREAAEELDVKLGSMLMPIRVAITGTPASPPLFGSMRLLDPDIILKRIDHAVSLLESGN